MEKYVCSVCGFVYDEAKGIPESGIAPGSFMAAFSYIPSVSSMSWSGTTCCVSRIL